MNLRLFRVLRAVVAFVVRRGYRFGVCGEQYVPSHGPAVVVANHVSFIDSVLLSVAFDRPMRFVMSHQYFENRWLQPFFRGVHAIPICPASHDPQMKEAAFATVAEALAAGELVCIFPEGRITKHGELNEFRPGVERIVKDTPVPILPVGIRGQWGSRFSRRGRLGRRDADRGRAALAVCIGAPITPHDFSMGLVREAVLALSTGSEEASNP